MAAGLPARGQHLLQRARSPRRRRPRRPGRADPRFAAHQHGLEIHLCRDAEGGADARRRDAGFRRRQGRPRHPLYADGAGSGVRDAGLRADRRGAFGGVRRLRRQGTRDPDRGRQAETDLLGELRHRARPHRAIQAAARRGDQAFERQAAGLHHPAAAAAGLRTHGRPRSRLGRAAPRRARCRQGCAVHAGAGDRSALYSLHVRHHGHSQGRRARQWRASGRAEMVDVQSLRRQARRGLVVRLRYRLGRRAQLHRLRAADPWRDLDHVRGQAGRHAGCRRVLARDLRAQGRRAVHRADRVPRHPQGGSGRRVHPANTTCRNSARCSWPASAPIRRRWNGRKRS